MNFLIKYLANYLQYKLSFLIAGQKNYDVWKTKQYSLKKVKINNKKLALELEKACQKNHGFLTYSEFLNIDQFGENGYHNHHSLHGLTGAHNHWGKAIAFLCREKKIENVLEFGPGEGELAIKALKELKKINHYARWSGVEVNEKFCQKIKERFKKEKFENQLNQATSSVKDIKIKEKCLVVFSYSLDSIPPDIFLNAGKIKSCPNSMIGISVKDGFLEEFILNDQQLKAKNMSFIKGVYRQRSGTSFDLTGWKLFPGQRVYFPIKSFLTFLDLVKKIPNDSLALVVDEFRESESPWKTSHFSLPKKLYAHKRDCDNLEKTYKEAGEHLFYYPFYFDSYYRFFHSAGLILLKYGIEQQMAREIAKERWISTKFYYATTSFLCIKGKVAQEEVIPLYFPQEKIF